MTGRLLLLSLWVAQLFVIITVRPEPQFTLLEPRSASFFALLGLFVASSACFLRVLGRAPIVWLHLGVTFFILILRPRSSVLGFDNALVICSAYLVAAFARLTGARRLTLVLASSLLGVLLVEKGVSALHRDVQTPAGVGDYSDMVGPYGEGGFLIPNLDMPIVTVGAGVGRVVTDRFGFRNRQHIDHDKPPGRYRIMIVGDSFVAGYRTDQEATVGRRIEILLRQGRPDLDVIVVGAGHPAAYVKFVRDHGLGFHPDVVVVGITMGNDMIQAWTAARNASDHRSVDMFLPRDAFKKDATLFRASTLHATPPEHRWAEMLLPRDAFKGDLALLPVSFERSLREWRWYATVRPLLWADVICPWFLGDGPLYARLFDPGNGLGVFYVRRPIEAVEQAYGDVAASLRDLAEISRASGVPIVVALFPQRFQVRHDEWKALSFDYGLDPSAFDLDAPSRRVSSACSGAAIACIDLLPEFRKRGGPPLYLPGGDMHWNPAGHALAADGIASALRARGLP